MIEREARVGRFRRCGPARTRGDEHYCEQKSRAKESDNHCEDVSRFSLLLSQQAANKLVYFFWYGLFNHAIVENYAAKNNVPPPTLVPLRSEADDRFWFWTFNSELVASEFSLREYLKYVLAKADFVVIPERLEAFQIMWPSPMTAYREDIAAALNSPDIAADYHVWAIIDERPDTRVFVLKKLDSESGGRWLGAVPSNVGHSSPGDRPRFQGCPRGGPKGMVGSRRQRASAALIRLWRL